METKSTGRWVVQYKTAKGWSVMAICDAGVSRDEAVAIDIDGRRHGDVTRIVTKKFADSAEGTK